jgi:hypothetical protein
LRICRDQHYAPRIAAALRERRTLVSENVADFVPLVHLPSGRGEDHHGLVFTSPASMPRGAGTIGMFVEALDRLMQERPTDDALQNRVHWLRPPA